MLYRREREKIKERGESQVGERVTRGSQVYVCERERKIKRDTREGLVRERERERKKKSGERKRGRKKSGERKRGDNQVKERIPRGSLVRKKKKGRRKSR